MPTPDEPESGACATPDPPSPPDQPPTSPPEGADGPGVTERRVAHIVGLMSRFEFRRGHTAQQLADEWGLSLSYVHDLTAEASKRVRATATADDVAAQIIPGLYRAFDTAAASSDPKALAAAASIAKVLASIAGIDAPKRHEHSGPEGGPVQVIAPGIYVPPEADE